LELLKSPRPKVVEHQHEASEIERALGDLTGRLILDLGCGRLRSLSTFLAHRGALVVGIDPIYMCVPGTPIWRRAIRSVEAGGPKEFIKDLAIALVKEPQIRRVTKRILLESGAKESLGLLHLVRGDGRALPFLDGSFDAVVSYDVLEHVPHVGDVAGEIARILRPGGLTRHVIDVFSGLLGGHDPYWALPPGVAPWNHLRPGGDTMSKEAGLNRLRVQDYIVAFCQWFSNSNVNHWTVPYPPARRFLTDEIRREFIDYSEEELLLRKLVVVGRKQSVISSGGSSVTNALGGTEPRASVPGYCQCVERWVK
jgi:SAM-dependent methyltransferase